MHASLRDQKRRKLKLIVRRQKRQGNSDDDICRICHSCCGDSEGSAWLKWIAYLLLLVGAETIFIFMFSAYFYWASTGTEPIAISKIVSTTEKPHALKVKNYNAEAFLSIYRETCENITWTRVMASKRSQSSANISLYCPCVPSDLAGRRPVTFEMPEIGEIELMHLELGAGGIWKPRDCLPRETVAIIIPFRDRKEHLRIFLHHMHPFLQRQLISYQIFVIEQKAPKVFNKASMMNVGFQEAFQLQDFNCYIFHDVDMLPEDDRNLYTCFLSPRHVGSNINKWNYTVPYDEIFGGAIALTKRQFQATNGFSNNYYGWGGEDDDMFRRVVSRNLTVVRYPGSVSTYTMLKHGHDAGNPLNVHGYHAWSWRPKEYQKDGLNSLRYVRRGLEYRPLYTWIYAEVPPPRFQFPIVRQRRRHKNSAARIDINTTYVLTVVLICVLTKYS